MPKDKVRNNLARRLMAIERRVVYGRKEKGCVLDSSLQLVKGRLHRLGAKRHVLPVTADRRRQTLDEGVKPGMKDGSDA